MSDELPVVECAIYTSATAGKRFRVCDLVKLPDDLPAVAIPWALLEDEGFRAAVKRRTFDPADAFREKRFFPALIAELRARAGVRDD